MAISKEEISAAQEAALLAISKSANLEELKVVKIEHVGDKSAVAKLNQGWGSCRQQIAQSLEN